MQRIATNNLMAATRQSRKPPESARSARVPTILAIQARPARLEQTATLLSSRGSASPSGSAPNCKKMLAALADQVTDRTMVKLVQTQRLIVWERIASGEILFGGQGIHIGDDLFTVGGRANWLLRTATHKNFGFVTPSATKESLAELQARWKRSLSGAAVAEVPDPYPAKEAGMSELRSPAAIEALIASLEPSAAKDAETKRCLHDVYKVDKLPTEPGSPGRLCDTNVLANRYLQTITVVPDEHPHAWWVTWWRTNGARLKWSADKARFVVP